ncbi:MAG: TIGR01212 family radical SAM protein [Acidobacteriota bacterium]|jgi:radical SAM protein (TIGR01212 family)|nr:TIGR01212 family radical SAM protein [Acidobacteriota bacterium]
MPPYNSYGRYLRDRFGCRVYKVGIDAGFDCPNRDGTLSTSGCAYCNNDSFRPKTSDRRKSVQRQMSEGMDYLRRRFGAEKFIAYFQAATGTYAPLDVLAPLYESALALPDVVGLAIGTRPDCVDGEKLDWLGRLAQGFFVTVEYGLQSASDATLRRINRGHDVRCWRDAVARTRNRGIHVGTHLILGFPWERREEALGGADAVSEAGVDFLKLHHLHVVRGSSLAAEYLASPFPLPTLREYAGLVADFLGRLAPGVYVERLFGTAPAELLVAPAWGLGKAEVRRVIEGEVARRCGGGAPESSGARGFVEVEGSL